LVWVLCRQRFSRNEQLPGQHPVDALGLKHDSVFLPANQKPWSRFRRQSARIAPHLSRARSDSLYFWTDRIPQQPGSTFGSTRWIVPCQSRSSTTSRTRCISGSAFCGQSLLGVFLGSGTRSSPNYRSRAWLSDLAGKWPSHVIDGLPTLRVPCTNL